MKTENLLIGLAALGIGGYLLINYWMKNSVVGQAGAAVGGAVDTYTKAAGAIGITPMDTFASLLIPWMGVSNVVTKVGEQAGFTPSDVMASAAFPPMAIANVITKLIQGTPKTTTALGTNTAAQIKQNVNMAAIRASTPMYDTPGKQVALATNKVIPYTSPSQQISTYVTAPKIIKVGGISKKVM